MQQRLSAGMTRRRLLLSGGGGVAVTLFLPELSAFAHAGRAVAELTEFPTKQVEARDMTAYIIGLRRSAPRLGPCRPQLDVHQKWRDGRYRDCAHRSDVGRARRQLCAAWGVSRAGCFDCR